MRREGRSDETEKAELMLATKEKELQKIKAQQEKLKAEISQQTKAMVKQIMAETDVKYQQIISEAKLIETDIITKARQEAAKMIAEADGEFLKQVSEAQKENANIISQAIQTEGKAQEKQMKAMRRKRKHTQIMERLNSMDSLSSNRKMVLFGEQGTNLMANIESFKLVYGADG